MGADHNRLDALRRLAKDRAATPAEKATARRLAKALADKIGKRPHRSRRKGRQRLRAHIGEAARRKFSTPTDHGYRNRGKHGGPGGGSVGEDGEQGHECREGDLLDGASQHWCLTA